MSALLVGWFGCKPHHLAKYKAIYESVGMHTTLFTEHCDPNMKAFTPKQLESNAEALFKIVEKKQPTVVHVFSNGGAFVWSKSLRLANSSPEKLQAFRCVNHQILDSTPGGGRDVQGTFHFLDATVGRAFSVAAFPVYGTLLVGLKLVHGLTGYNVGDRWKDYWLEDLAHTEIRNTLFLYSTKDLLISSDTVTEFADTLQKQQSNHGVSRQMWTDTGHVVHFKKHPQQYTQLIHEFLRK